MTSMLCHGFLPTVLALNFLVLLSPFQGHAKRNGGTNKPSTASNVRDYNLSISNIRYSYINPEYFGPQTKIQLNSPTEYTYRIEVLQTLPADAKSITYTFEKNNRDEYVPSITMRETLCEEYKKDVQNLPMYRCAHFLDAGIKECPYKKGVYFASHVRCSSNEAPPMLPGHYWRINRTWIGERNIQLLHTTLDVIIERKPIIRIGH